MVKGKMFNKISLFLLTAIVIFTITPFAKAVSNGSLSVLPYATNEYPEKRSWFVYEIDLGESITDKAVVVNGTNKSVDLTIAALDAAITSTGGYTLVGNTGQNKDVGTWVEIEKTHVTLPPHSQEIIDFTITVPEDADVGSHPGGLTIWRTAEETHSKNAMISILTRIAARIYVTVPGDIVRSLEVSNIKHSVRKGILYFSMNLKNNGNVQLTPETDIALRGLFGRIGNQEKSALGMILRSTEIKATIPWQKKAPFFGRFVADFRIHYGEKDFKGDYVVDEYIDAKYIFWIIPWWNLLILLIILILLFFIRNLWKWLIIRKRLNEKTKKHKVKKGETLTIIADIYDVNPKKIAKFNLLKWPYDLIEGDILLIPQGKMTKAEKEASKQDKKGPKKLEPVVAEKGDTVKDVASFAETSAQEIITINRLKWPYRLKEDQELMIPTQKEIVDDKKSTKKSKKQKVKLTKKQTKPKKRKK